VICSFCGKTAPKDRAFSSADDSDGRCVCICHDCVRDLYIAMIAEEMRSLSRARDTAPLPSSSVGAQIIRLHPRKDQ
jgi:hypothetical protein